MKLQNKDHFHGSDLEKIEEVYGIRKEDIISFSDNVNPLGISRHLRESLSAHLDAITSYPDREYKELRKTIAGYIGSRAENIVVGNGSTELISLAVRVLDPKKALLPEPTYSEYEREITLAGGELVRCEIKKENGFRVNIGELETELTEDFDLLILCNPNNPTSQAIMPEDMRRLLESCRKKNVFVMVDETYVEFVPSKGLRPGDGVTSVPLTEEFENLLILRGTSKFFSAPGLRLGYAVTGNKELLEKLRKLQNPWTISSLAEMAGRLMFRDGEYIRRTRETISRERTRVCGILDGWDSVEYFEPAANFVLVHIRKKGVTAADLFDHCIRQGLMIRDCSTFAFLDDTWFRFCFRTQEEDDRLLTALQEKLEYETLNSAEM